VKAKTEWKPRKKKEHNKRALEIGKSKNRKEP